MKDQHLFLSFTKQYPVQKTLRFELKPIGNTLQNIEKKGFIKADKQRAEDYKQVKEIIDEYHRAFIEESLNGLKLSVINDYFDLYIKKDPGKKKELEGIKKNLRKQIAEAFRKNERFQTIDKKELITKELEKVIEQDKDKLELIDKFKRFTTYFTGFHENRKNMYVAEDKSTAIAYRIVHENLPKFVDNIMIYQKIKMDAPDLIQYLQQSFKETNTAYTANNLGDVFSLEFFNHTLSQKGIDDYNRILRGKPAQENEPKIKGLNEYINTDFNQKQTEKNKKLPRFKQLYKQILSDKGSASFIIEEFEDDNEVLESIETFYQNELCDFEADGQRINVFNATQNLLEHLHTFDLSKVYLRNGRSITDISNAVFGDQSVIHNALQEYYINHNPKKERGKSENFEKRVEEWVRRTDFFTIQTIQNAVNESKIDAVNENNKPDAIIHYFADAGLKKLKELDENNTKNLFEKVTEAYKNIKDLLNTKYPDNKSLIEQKGEHSDVQQIKDFLDRIMDVIHFYCCPVKI